VRAEIGVTNLIGLTQKLMCPQLSVGSTQCLVVSSYSQYSQCTLTVCHNHDQDTFISIPTYNDKGDIAAEDEDHDNDDDKISRCHNHDQDTFISIPTYNDKGDIAAEDEDHDNDDDKISRSC